MSVSVLDDLWPVAVRLVERGVRGTFNFNNPGVITHERILELYREHVAPTHTWRLLPYDGSRPAAELSAAKLAAYGFTLPDVNASVERMMLNAAGKLASSALATVRHSLDTVDPSFGNSLKFKNILVTGGAGFIGISFFIYYIEHSFHFCLKLIEKIDSIHTTG